MALTPEQLYQRQQQYGQLISGAAGFASLGEQWGYDQHKNDYINFSTPPEETGYDGKPIYNLGGVQQNINQIDTSGPSAGSVGAGAIKGASAGAAIGSVIPVVGTAIGGLVGGLIGGVGSAISGVIGSDKAKRKQRLAQQNLRMAQRMYNTHMAQFNTQQAGQQAYQDTLNNSNREFNIYKYNSPYTV